ncbi:CopD family protein [Rubellimicrobium aerolatum]|uniref:Protoporphyrinogen IX oxidase n=1 Tax=Rubellimicrobium aerolatum TaxID=490979 RepID=A0ABW0SCR2_9RHOB|nr:CopD family protein [Rubellimicrobium aerolatum]MBP1806625.1 putative membrane protein [Rubellimicrobium aerolatum]
MIYYLTVTLHLVAMVLWMSPMIAVPVILMRHGPHVPKPDVVDRLRAAFRGLATPGLVLTWLFGIANAVQGGWFTEGWLHAKLVFVLALSALHGIALGRLRRLETGGAVPGLLKALPGIVLALVFGAVLLAEWKPF